MDIGKEVILCVNRKPPRLYENTFALDMRNLTARSWHISEALHNKSWMLVANFPSSKSVNLMSSPTLKMIKWDFVRRHCKQHSPQVMDHRRQRATTVTSHKQLPLLCWFQHLAHSPLTGQSAAHRAEKPLFRPRCGVAAVGGGGGGSQGLERKGWYSPASRFFPPLILIYLVAYLLTEVLSNGKRSRLLPSRKLY